MKLTKSIAIISDYIKATNSLATNFHTRKNKTFTRPITVSVYLTYTCIYTEGNSMVYFYAERRGYISLAAVFYGVWSHYFI